MSTQKGAQQIVLVLVCLDVSTSLVSDMFTGSSKFGVVTDNDKFASDNGKSTHREQLKPNSTVVEANAFYDASESPDMKGDKRLSTIRVCVRVHARVPASTSAPPDPHANPFPALGRCRAPLAHWVEVSCLSAPSH